MEHVEADGSRILVSPIQSDNKVYAAFTGRCLSCPNIENISVRQLQAAVPEFEFQLYPEWRNWLDGFLSAKAKETTDNNDIKSKLALV